jgi:hypothetical protein
VISRNHRIVSFVKPPILNILVIVFVALIFCGCSTTATPIVSEWRNPAYAAGPFRRIIVGGPTGDISVRRNFEDEFVAQLQTAGVNAVPSYRYLPEDQGIDEGKLKQAAQQAHADAVLFANSVQIEQRTQYGPAFPLSLGVFGSNVGAAWSPPIGAPNVDHYTEYTSETSLYDVGKNELVWSGTIKTTEPENAQTAIRSYVETVIKSLEAQNLLPGKH